jgi:hypothetical protein
MRKNLVQSIAIAVVAGVISSLIVRKIVAPKPDARTARVMA